MSGNLKQIILIAVTIAAVPPVDAAEHVDAERVIACSKERNDARRLACYDRAVGTAAAPMAKASSVSPAVETARPAAPPPPAPAAVVAPEQEFGIGGSAVARQRLDEQQQEADKIRSISAEVTEVTSRPHGELVITLSNGQVWMQKDPQRFPIKRGDSVKIDAGTLGSFHMKSANRSTRVTRVK